MRKFHGASCCTDKRPGGKSAAGDVESANCGLELTARPDGSGVGVGCVPRRGDTAAAALAGGDVAAVESEGPAAGVSKDEVALAAAVGAEAAGLVSCW